jgi:cytochrome c-type protein NapB
MRCTLGKSLMWSQGIGLAMVAILLSACGPGQAQSDLNNPERWESRDEFLSSRKELRAYDGAPSVIPHSVTDLGRNNCAGCHTPGASDTVTIGPARSHPAWENCTQCHVERQTAGSFRASTFEPLWWPAAGTRQREIAPPTIPHHIQNRENSAVCHIGEHAPAVLRAGHGIRPNCSQCHVPAGAGGVSR